MKNTLALLFLALLVLFTTCSDVWAQVTAQITGTVRDQTRGVAGGRSDRDAN